MESRLTIQDAVILNDINKRFGKIFTANDGEIKLQGTECVICNETYDKEETIYCKCDDGFVCAKCCSHCGFIKDGECTWK